MQGFFNEVALDLVRADGTKLSVLANARERRDPDGNLLFTRLTILEATERRRYRGTSWKHEPLPSAGLQRNERPLSFGNILSPFWGTICETHSQG